MRLEIEAHFRHAEQTLKAIREIAVGKENLKGLKSLGNAEAIIICFAHSIEGKWTTTAKM